MIGWEREPDVAEGDFKIVPTTNGQFQTGFVFGHPYFGKDGWGSFRIKKTSREGECAYFSPGWEMSAGGETWPRFGAAPLPGGRILRPERGHGPGRQPPGTAPER